MDELSLHILDIVQNSIKADASLVEIIINEKEVENLFQIIIKDNGLGMSQKTINQACDPFYTTRKTRDIGMGLSLFKMACELTDGNLAIQSKENTGTTIEANFKYHHIDRAPLGNISDTLCILILNERNVDIYYKHNKGNKTFIFDTKEIKNILGNIPFNNSDVLYWIKDYLKNGLLDINKEDLK